MEHEFRANKRVIRRTREEVIAALRGVKPARLRTHTVRIGGTDYPVKQAFGIAFGLDHADFGTQTARRAFMRLGCNLDVRSTRPRGTDTSGRPSLKPDNETDRTLPMEFELLAVAIDLEWEWWEWWEDLARSDMTGEGVGMPHCPGVYEVKVYGEDRLLYIGRASNLEMRVKHGLVKGSSVHPAGNKIRRNEDLSRLCVRWATTDRPAAAEEELLRRHMLRFGAPPKYTIRT